MKQSAMIKKLLNIKENIMKRKIIYIDTNNILELFLTKSRITNLPKDFKILSVFYDHKIASFEILVESESFESVPIGEQFPELICELKINNE